MKLSALFVLVTAFVFFDACHKPQKTEKRTLSVFCAAGLTDAMTEFRDSFVRQYPVELRLNLASSGTLVRQMEMGNRADIFISANRRWADYADSLRLFKSRKEICRNRLVVIAPINSSIDSMEIDSTLSDFTGYLSMGDPAHVPAGQYAREALVNLDLWDPLQNRILPAKDVRSALLPVELGECSVGIVYYSDALASEKVKIVGVFPEVSHSPIIFYALLSKPGGKDVQSFYDMLTDSGSMQTWKRYGFMPVEQQDQ